MDDLTPDWRFDFSRLALSQRQAGPGIPQIGDAEIMPAFFASRQLFSSPEYPSRDNRYFLIGFTSKFRFVLVDLSVGDDALLIHDVALADESQVQELYCGRAAS